MSFPVEKIPIEHCVFKWFPRSKCDALGRPKPEAYVSKGAGMSSSWCWYCTAEESRAWATRPRTVNVVSLSVRGLRKLSLAVVHSPRELSGMWIGFPKQAQAHVDVVGVDDPQVQLELRTLADVEVRADPIGPK